LSRHRTSRSRWLSRAALAAALAPLVAGALVAPAAWAGEATPADDEIVHVEAAAAPADVEPHPEPDLEPALEPGPAPAPAAADPGAPRARTAQEAPASGLDVVTKAVTPVLQPGQSIVVNRTITGVAVLVVGVAGEPGQKRIEVVNPAGELSAAVGSSPTVIYRLDPGSNLADGSYRILIHNLSDEAMQLAYEIAWSPADVTFTPRGPVPNTGLMVATEARAGSEPLPDGTTATARATAPDGTELSGTLTRVPGSPFLWRAYLGAVTGDFIVEARFDTGAAVYSNVWATSGESPDVLPPVLGYETEPAASNARGWFARPVVVTLTGSDAGTGVDRIEWAIGAGSVEQAAGGRVQLFLDHGNHTIVYRAIDLAGNASEWRERIVNIDTVAPTVEAVSPAPAAEYRLGEPVTVEFRCADASSGVFECRAPLASGATLPTDAEGDFTFEIVATDRAGNLLRMPVAYRVVDPGLPTATVDLPQPDGADDWYLDFPTIELVGSPETVALHWVDTVDGVEVTGSSSSPTATFTPNREGIHGFRYWAVDSLGRTGEPAYLEFKVDASEPVVVVRAPAAAAARAALAPGEVLQGSALVADFECSDAVSGVASCVGSTPDGERLPTGSLGTREFTVTATDAAGHTVRQVVTYRVVAAPAGQTGGLATTGADVAAWLVPLGLLLLASGAAVVVVSRHRSAHREA